MRLYIIRHADPDYPIDSITAMGHREAEALAERLQKEGIDRLYASPMGRARATMWYTEKALHKKGEILEWAAEHARFSAVTKEGESMFAVNLHGELLRENSAYLTFENWSKMPLLKNPNIARTVQATVQGSDEFIRSLGYQREDGRYRCIAPTQDKVAIFCHGGLGLTWLSHLLMIPPPLIWSGFWLPPTSVTTVLFDQRSDAYAIPRCLHVGDTSHLYHAGLPVLPRGIVSNYH